eukprot:scaffold18095_cov143-Skeletonema_menzelii.AAC.4
MQERKTQQRTSIKYKIRAEERRSSKIMATYNNNTGCAILLLVAALLTMMPSSYGFNINTTQKNNPSRHRSRLPPLFYTDIEPEIQSITIPPTVFVKGKSIVVRSDELDVADTSVITKPSKNDALTKKRTKTKTKASTDKKSSPPKEKKTHEAVWHRHYANLLQYKEEHGNCLVPQNYSENRKLGLWVMQQRRQYSLMQQGKNSSLSGKRGEYRLQLLEEAGFVWRLDRRGPRGSYGALTRTKPLTGHEIHTVANFEQFMIEKGADFTEDEKRSAWLKRFELLH